MTSVNSTAQDKFGNPESKYKTLSKHPAHLLDGSVTSPDSNSKQSVLRQFLQTRSSHLIQLFLGRRGWACLPLLKGRESFSILFCILLPQIALSNLRLAGNLEILILIRRISIATGEGSLGHILCSERDSKESVAVLWTQTK